jgi:FlaA1/EpsC-like NDP-sugar epimerase
MIDNRQLLELLGRNKSFFQKDLETNSKKLFDEIENKSVLIIGGAGTIGFSFLKAILNFRPNKVVIIDQNENGLVEVVRTLRSTKNQYLPKEFLTYPIDFSGEILKKVYNNHTGFDIVANFAAHKHVRSEKDIFSIEALINNNFLNNKNLLDFLVLNPPKHFFCVSTDKAANPVNVMGASKKLMEEVLLLYSTKFKITTARFANVAFSNGSLLDGFINRISMKQPLACPLDVKRFFITKEEAGQICLLAAILGKSGSIFFPKFDQINNLMSFTKFIQPLLNSYGFEPEYFSEDQLAVNNMDILKDLKYPVYLFKSDTSGEKLYEEFYTSTDPVDFNMFSSLGVITRLPEINKNQIDKLISDLNEIFNNAGASKSSIIGLLRNVISNFEHLETGMNLDSKM